MGRDGSRGASPLVATILLVGVAVIIGSVIIFFGTTFIAKTDQDTSFTVSFEFERVDGELRIRPSYVRGNASYDLLINGRQAYTWRSVTTRNLTCLKRGDTVKIVTDDPDAEGSHLVRSQTIETPTACGLDGVGSQFAYARVGDRQVPVAEQQYGFTLSIDPDGPTDVKGDTDIPASNPWNVIFRYDTAKEGFDPPVYLIIFADNVGDYSSDPPDDLRENVKDTFEFTGNDDELNVLGPTPSGKTDDVYFLFKPGCDQSKFIFIQETADYDNQILLDGEVVIENTNNANEDTVQTTSGVQCV